MFFGTFWQSLVHLFMHFLIIGLVVHITSLGFLYGPLDQIFKSIPIDTALQNNVFWLFIYVRVHSYLQLEAFRELKILQQFSRTISPLGGPYYKPFPYIYVKDIGCGLIYVWKTTPIQQTKCKNEPTFVFHDYGSWLSNFS